MGYIRIDMKSQIFIILFILLLPIVYASSDKLFHWETTISYTLALLCLVLLTKTISSKRKQTISITILDIAITLYFLYNLILIYATDSSYIGNSDICKWGTTIGVYILICRLQNKKVVFYALVFSGTEEAMTAIGQKLSLLDSGHTQFEVTGHLGNPGPLGGYLAVCLIIASYLLWERYLNKKWWSISGLTIAVTLMTIGLILADSRAAIMGLVAGCTLLLSSHYSLFRKYKKTILITSTSFLLLFGALLYLYRPQSGNARLLIWKVSSEMLTDRPWSGHGVGSFPRQYMFYQAHHFENNNHTEEMMVADNAAYPYNELLHLAIETGIPGLLFALFVIAGVYMKSDSQHPPQPIARAGITSWLLFSMFSYPTDIFPVLLLFPLLSGCLHCRSILSCKTNRLSVISLSAMYLTIGIWAYTQGHLYQKASYELSFLSKENNTKALEFANTYHSQLKSNIKFNMLYAGWLAKHSCKPEDIPKIIEIIPGTETYCWLGDYYRRIGMNEQAEEAYRIASFMVPTRLRPQYKLWRLYLEKGDTVKAVWTARQALHQPLKVENSFTINAKSELNDYLLKTRNLSK